VITSEATRRTWIALGLAEVLFGVAYPVCAGLALMVPARDAHDGWADLGLIAMLLVVGLFAAVVGVPVGVHTVGRLTAKWVDTKSSTRASLAHFAMALAVGGVLAAAMIPLARIEPLVAVIAFAVPIGLVGLGTNLLMPLAVRHTWVRIAALVLGAVPVLGAVSFIIALRLGALR